MKNTILFICLLSSVAGPAIALSPDWKAGGLFVQNQQDQNLKLKMEQRLQATFERVKKSRQVRANDYYDDQPPALIDYARIRSAIAHMGGRVIEKDGHTEVIWSRRSLP